MEGTIVLAIAITSLIVHLICAGQIAWQKWNYQKEDNIVYSIQLPKNHIKMTPYLMARMSISMDPQQTRNVIIRFFFN